MSLSPVKQMLEAALKRKRSVPLTCKADVAGSAEEEKSVSLTCKADVGGCAEEETKRPSHL